MSKNLIPIIEANNQYSKKFDKGDLSASPKKNIAILTCMDARFDPARALGLEEGDAHVIRNAGGRVTDDAIRSLIVSHKLLGTVEWFLIQHTDCGIQKISDEETGAYLGYTLGDTAPTLYFERGHFTQVHKNASDVGWHPNTGDRHYIKNILVHDKKYN